MHTYIKFFKDIVLADIPEVGGKNASLGEMVHYLAPQGVNLPNGFAPTLPLLLHPYKFYKHWCSRRTRAH